MLFGIVMLSHHVGGYLFQATGSYGWVWYIDIALALGAAPVNLPIREARLARAFPASAVPRA